MARTAALNEQLGVIQQCHVSGREGFAHVSASCAIALGHSWRLPYLLRILGIPFSSLS